MSINVDDLLNMQIHGSNSDHVFYLLKNAYRNAKRRLSCVKPIRGYGTCESNLNDNKEHQRYAAANKHFVMMLLSQEL